MSPGSIPGVPTSQGTRRSSCRPLPPRVPAGSPRPAAGAGPSGSGAHLARAAAGRGVQVERAAPAGGVPFLRPAAPPLCSVPCRSSPVVLGSARHAAKGEAASRHGRCTWAWPGAQTSERQVQRGGGALQGLCFQGVLGASSVPAKWGPLGPSGARVPQGVGRGVGRASAGHTWSRRVSERSTPGLAPRRGLASTRSAHTDACGDGTAGRGGRPARPRPASKRQRRAASGQQLCPAGRPRLGGAGGRRLELRAGACLGVTLPVPADGPLDTDRGPLRRVPTAGGARARSAPGSSPPSRQAGAREEQRPVRGSARETPAE